MTPDQTATIIARTLEGAPQRTIAQELGGLAHTTVGRAQQRPEIRAIIEREAAQIIQRGLRPARRTLTRLAAAGNSASCDPVTAKLALDASKHITSIAGLSGGAPGTVINAMIQINQAPEQSVEVAALSQYLASIWGNEPSKLLDIDATNKPLDIEEADVATSHTEAPCIDNHTGCIAVYTGQDQDGTPVDNSGCQPK